VRGQASDGAWSGVRLYTGWFYSVERITHGPGRPESTSDGRKDGLRDQDFRVEAFFLGVAGDDGELSGPYEKEGTHTACDRRLQVEGGEARCSYCVPHHNCELLTPEPQPIQGAWPNLRMQEGESE
jgi:hypothetical protein